MLEFAAGFLTLLSAALAASTALLVKQNIKVKTQLAAKDIKLLSEQNTSTKLLEAKEEAERGALEALTGVVSDSVIKDYLSKNPSRIQPDMIEEILKTQENIPDYVWNAFQKKFSIDDFGHAWKVSRYEIGVTERHYINYAFRDVPAVRTKVHKICINCGLEHVEYFQNSDAGELNTASSAKIEATRGLFLNNQKLPKSFLCSELDKQLEKQAKALENKVEDAPLVKSNIQARNKPKSKAQLKREKEARVFKEINEHFKHKPI